jgi:hypothetical protein
LKFAEWLLTAFGVNESVHGDLLEASADRSAVWLLWQTAAAVALHVARELRSHPLLTLRAVATGWILTVAWGRLVWLFVTPPGEAIPTSFKLYRIVTVFVWPVIVGWLVARTHRAQPVAMVLAYAASAVLWWTWLHTVYSEHFSRLPVQFWLVIYGIDLLLTLVGGFLQKPRRGAGGVG